MIVVIGLLIGVVLGLTGSGGSILAVPLLLLFLGLQPNDAMGVALIAVCASTLVGVIMRLRDGQIAWQQGFVLALSGVVTAPLGRWLGAQLNEQLLLFAFTILVLAIAWRMWCQASHNTVATTEVRARVHGQHGASDADLPAQLSPRRIRNLIPAGLMIGLLSGLFGVGSGFLIVPVLTLIAGVKIERAVATSLLVISIVSAVGFLSHVTIVTSLPLPLMLKISGGSIAGILLATFFAPRIAGARLQKTFALLAVTLMLVNAAVALL